MDIWKACGATDKDTTPISGTLLRLVESQEQVATNKLVSSLADQALLEDMLEKSKPSYKTLYQDYHYLLATPFRYPPLQHGSRFGTKQEPSLFYGSQTITTLFAEAAYYRFYFWLGMTVPPKNKIKSQHTLFVAKYQANRGMQLHAAPFTDYQKHITHPESYADSQQLGQRLRDLDVQAFEYVSARFSEYGSDDQDKGINVALFTPLAFAKKRPDFTQQVLCETNGEQVGFYLSNQQEFYSYTLEQFYYKKHFPLPAN